MHFGLDSLTIEVYIANMTTELKKQLRALIKARSVQDGKCTVWIGRIQKEGYGVLSLHGITHRAHRLAWELRYGLIPPGMFICHHCDNPPCIRLAHLFIGDNAENMADMRRKGRQALGDKNGSHTHPLNRPRGTRHGRTKLTEANVLTIREQYEQGIRLMDIARKFGVSLGAIAGIVYGTKWKHVPFHGALSYRYNVGGERRI